MSSISIIMQYYMMSSQYLYVFSFIVTGEDTVNDWCWGLPLFVPNPTAVDYYASSRRHYLIINYIFSY